MLTQVSHTHSGQNIVGGFFGVHLQKRIISYQEVLNFEHWEEQIFLEVPLFQGSCFPKEMLWNYIDLLTWSLQVWFQQRWNPGFWGEMDSWLCWEPIFAAESLLCSVLSGLSQCSCRCVGKVTDIFLVAAIEPNYRLTGRGICLLLWRPALQQGNSNFSSEPDRLCWWGTSRVFTTTLSQKQTNTQANSKLGADVEISIDFESLN